MKTSYFAKYRGEQGISIASKSPPGFKGKKFPELFPPIRIVINYKAGKITESQYTEVYKREILKKLNPAAVFAELGPDAVLLCWEGSDKFCHRHIVAKWLKLSIGEEVYEF